MFPRLNFFIKFIIFIRAELTIIFWIFQQWNQLSRFQKNLVLIALCGAVFTIFVLIQGQEKLLDKLFSSSSSPSQHINDRIQIVPMKVSRAELDVRSALDTQAI